MTRAQLHPSDDLGWLVDRMADPDGDHRLCPKACARAKAALLREREMMALAAERDRALCAEVDDLQRALTTRGAEVETWVRIALVAQDDRMRLRTAVRKLLLSRDVTWTGGHDWQEAVDDAIAEMDYDGEDLK